jgi:HSP20 family protein
VASGPTEIKGLSDALAVSSGNVVINISTERLLSSTLGGVYGYSMTFGPDGRPKVRKFGNVRSPFSGRGLFTRPLISSEREPLTEVTTLDKDVIVVVEMPGVIKEDIQIKSYDNSVETSATGPRKYHEVINLPEEVDVDTAKSVFNNGILEITFNKKEKSKPKGKEIKVE